jgi:hypothetical protein
MGRSDAENAELHNHELELDGMSDEAREAIETITRVMAGRTRESACAIMCAVSAMSGFYGEAIRFAQMAASHKASIVAMEASSR